MVAMLAIGLSLVLGVGIFAALTRGPRRPGPAEPRHLPFSAPPQGGAHVF